MSQKLSSFCHCFCYIFYTLIYRELFILRKSMIQFFFAFTADVRSTKFSFFLCRKCRFFSHYSSSPYLIYHKKMKLASEFYFYAIKFPEYQTYENRPFVLLQNSWPELQVYIYSGKSKIKSIQLLLIWAQKIETK